MDCLASTSRAEFQGKDWKETVCPLLVGARGEFVLRNLLKVSCGEKLRDLRLDCFGGPEHLAGTIVHKYLSRRSFLC